MTPKIIRPSKTKWYKNGECLWCESFRKKERGRLGDILVKKRKGEHRHLTKKELEEISWKYQQRILKDAEEAERSQAVSIETRHRIYR